MATRKKIPLIPSDAAISITAAKTLTVPLDASVSGTNTGDQNLAPYALDADVVHDTGNETIAGIKTFSSDPLIPDEAYGVGWNGSLEPATKNAIYDKIETLPGGHDAVTVTDSAEIDFTLTGQNITASIVAGSIDETKLDVSTNASLDLADSALQAANISDTAYDATTWDAVTTIAPSKNSVRDKIETMVSAIALNTAKVTNATHTGDVTGDTALTIANDAVTYAKMQNVSATGKVLGRKTAAAGDVEELDIDTDLSSVSASDDTVPSAKATKTALDLKAPLASPTFTGTVVLPNSQALVTPVLGTPTSGTLTNCTGLPVNGIVDDTTSALGVGSIELGHASDTTIARVSAGVASIEGVNILTVAGGTMTGNITLGENTSLDLDPAGSADGKYSGIAVTGTAGEALAFGDVIVLDVTAGKWFKGSVSAAAAADGDLRGMVGMCVLAAAGDASATKILLQGMCRADANFPALTIGAAVYATTTGDITLTQPTTTDHIIRVLGFAMTADEVYFNPSPNYITHT